MVNQPGAVYEMVPLHLQLEAMDFIKKNIFTTPVWLLDTVILARIGESPTQTITRSQDMVLRNLLSTNTVSRLAVNEAMYGDKAYRLIHYFNDIDKAMWTELAAEQPIDLYRRNLQRSYIDHLITLSDKSGKDYRDVGPILKNKLMEIHAVVKKGIRKAKDPMTIYHLKYIENRLAEVVEER